jgi:uncharacterized protein (DUF4415 family)
MNEKNLNKHSKTDWDRIDKMTDDEIDLSDSPALDETFFANAGWRMPANSKPVMLSVDSEVLEWFEDQGAEFQYRINAALKIYADAHRQ